MEKITSQWIVQGFEKGQVPRIPRIVGLQWLEDNENILEDEDIAGLGSP